MPRPSRLRRLICVLEQMLATLQSRSIVSLPPRGDEDASAIMRQRQHVEWLCDHDLDAFRVYTRTDLVGACVFPLTSVRHTLTWGHDGQDTDTLYYGNRPFVFYMPGKITYLLYVCLGADLHRFDLELVPLALEDIIALDLLANFGRPVDPTYPRVVVFSTLLTDDNDEGVDDMVIGDGSHTIGWSDVFVDDYLLVEVSVSRDHTGDNAWGLRYNLRRTTRLASS